MSEEIFEEAEEGHVDGVRRLVEEHGVDPNARRVSDGRTPLHYASRDGQFPVVRYLVEEAQVNVDMPDIDGFTALHFACNWHHLPVARYLVETGGANIEARTSSGQTALHLASRAGFTDVVQYLVEQRQANVDAKNRLGQTPLDRVFTPRNDQLSKKRDTFRYLLPRTSCITRITLVDAWRYENLDDIGVTVLEKYASGQSERMGHAFRRNPIHTLLSQFPLIRYKTIQDYIMIYPSSVLSLLDDEGRLAIHVALALRRSGVSMAIEITRFLFQREPRSALARDPTTGLYPHETAACMLSEYTDDEDSDDESDFYSLLGDLCLDLVYILFRSNPQHLLRSRAQSGKALSLFAQNGERERKRPKTIRGAVNEDSNI